MDELRPYAELIHGEVRSPLLVTVEEGFPVSLLDTQVFGSPDSFAARRRHFRPEYPLNMDRVRDYVEGFHARVYATSSVDLTGASPKLQDALLKLVEEPGDTRLVLWRGLLTPVTETLVSRCFTTALPSADGALRAAVLGSEGVPRQRIESLPDPFPGSLADARMWCMAERGPLDELLAAFEGRDVVRALTASRGFERQQARLLELTIRGHLGGYTVSGLSRLPRDLLAEWSSVLATVPPGLAVRFGILEAL